ncbi:MAG TPA: PAS domain-containing protein [Pseudomonadales bacterium]|nr:PAS domain-containing protein [Pseudomonadales bacterium]
MDSFDYDEARQLVDEVVFVSDTDRDIFFVTPSVTTVLGYAEDAFRRLKTIDLIHPEDLSSAARTASLMRSEDRGTYRTRLRILHANGTYVPCEIIGRNLLHEPIGGVVTTLRRLDR